MKILKFDQVESTNNLAFDLFAQGAAVGHTIILADSQTKGRGRSNRDWISPAGNLYMSLLLQIDDAARATNYSFLAACVLGDALQSFGVKTAYKWPNDLMLDGKKLAGILLEKKNINHCEVLVIGLGLNLVSSPAYATSLQNFQISREEILEKFCEIFTKLEAEYKNFGFTFLRNKWLKNCYKFKEKVTLSSGQSGIFNGIDSAGNLLLLDENGVEQKIAVAEILR